MRCKPAARSETELKGPAESPTLSGEKPERVGRPNLQSFRESEDTRPMYWSGST
jgi:hypothetical protein